MPDKVDSLLNKIKFLKAGKGQVIGSGKEPERSQKNPDVPENISVVSQQICYLCEICKCSFSSDILVSHVQDCSKIIDKTDMYANELVLYVFKMVNHIDRNRKAIDLLEKSVNNIINNPQQEKYRKIRLQNKLFTQNITCCHFGVEMYLFIGFSLIIVDEVEFLHLVLDEIRVSRLSEILASVRAYIPPKKLSSRNAGIVQHKTPHIIHKESEYEPDVGDLLIHREYKQKVREINEMCISTKAKEKLIKELTGGNKQISELAIIRIRFPDTKYLEGTFTVNEHVEDVYKFIEENITRTGHTFLLYKSDTKRIPLNRSTSRIRDNDMAPRCTLLFEWDDNSKSSYLKKF